MVNPKVHHFWVKMVGNLDFRQKMTKRILREFFEITVFFKNSKNRIFQKFEIPIFAKILKTHAILDGLKKKLMTHSHLVYAEFSTIYNGTRLID